MTDAHPTSETIAAYLDGALATDARVRLERHVAECVSCRREVREVEAMLATSPGAPRFRLSRRVAIPGVFVAAAAAIAFVVLPRRADTPMLRDGAAGPVADAPTAVVIVAPPRGATVGDGALRLAWRSVAADANYHAALVDSIGHALWSVRTSDTTAVLPADVLARVAGRAFWYVDALRPDGHSATSGMTELRVAR